MRIGGIMGACGGLAALESKLTKYLVEKSLTRIPMLGEVVSLQVPRLYGFVVLNAVGSCLVMFFLGMGVGQSRKTFIEKAKKEGDEHAEARFSYPKIYAE